MTVPPEPAADEARRWLAAGRVVIRALTGRTVLGEVRDARGRAIARVSGDLTSRWTCTCTTPGVCAHGAAVGLVIAQVPDGTGRSVPAPAEPTG